MTARTPTHRERIKSVVDAARDAIAALTSPSEDSSTQVELPLDDTLDAICNRRRRVVIKIVAANDDPIEAGTLAESIAVAETGADHIDAATRKSAYVGLIQTHLETLDKLGVIAYDERDKTTEATDVTHQLAALIEHIESVCNDDV